MKNELNSAVIYALHNLSKVCCISHCNSGLNLAQSGYSQQLFRTILRHSKFHSLTPRRFGLQLFHTQKPLYLEETVVSFLISDGTKANKDQLILVSYKHQVLYQWLGMEDHRRRTEQANKRKTTKNQNQAHTTLYSNLTVQLILSLCIYTLCSHTTT